MKIKKMITDMGITAREAGRYLARALPGDKNRALAAIADKLRKSEKMLISEHLKDLEDGEKAGCNARSPEVDGETH